MRMMPMSDFARPEYTIVQRITFIDEALTFVEGAQKLEVARGRWATAMLQSLERREPHTRKLLRQGKLEELLQEMDQIAEEMREGYCNLVREHLKDLRIRGLKAFRLMPSTFDRFDHDLRDLEDLLFSAFQVESDLDAFLDEITRVLDDFAAHWGAYVEVSESQGDGHDSEQLVQSLVKAIGSIQPPGAPGDNPPPPPKKRGRKPQYSAEKDTAFAEAWERARDAGIAYVEFCKDMGISCDDADLTLARVRMRRK
jgi:hypothetical protein